MYDFDRFSKHDQIGQVVIPLNSVDLGRVVEEWRVLVSPVQDEKVRPQASLQMFLQIIKLTVSSAKRNVKVLRPSVFLRLSVAFFWF